MAEIIVPFTIDEDDVNTLDTVPVTLVTFGNGDTIVHVPTRLELWREAGTAYEMVGAFPGYKPLKDTEAYTPEGNSVEPIWSGHKLLIYESNTHLYSGRSDRGNVLFRVPLTDFVNGALATSLVVLPESGLALRPGNVTIKAESLVGLSGGTGDIRGNLYFDERPL